MADFTKTVDIIFGGRDDVSRAVRDVSRSLQSLETGVADVARPLANVTDAILKFDAVLAGVALTMLGFSLNEAIRFESAQLDLQKVLSDSEGSVDQYKDAIEDLALTYGSSAVDVTQSAANFKQAGFDIHESLSLTEAALVATKISQLDAAGASDLMVASLKGFDAPARDAARILDIWNETSNQFATNTVELAQGFADLSPVAKLAGLSFEETAALLTPVIEVYRSGSEAARALRTGLLSLGTESAPVAKAMEILGVSQKDANGALRSAGDILFDVQKKFVTLSDAQKLYVTELIVGKDQAGRFSIALDGLSKTHAVLEVATNSSGSAQRELQIRLAAGEEALKRFKAALELTSKSIGDQYLVESKQAIDATAKLLVAFKDVVDNGGLEPLFSLLRPLIQEFTRNILTIKDNLPAAFEGVDFSGFVSSLRELGYEIMNLFEGIDLDTPEGLAAAIQKIVDTGESLVRLTSGIVESFKPLFDALSSGVTDFNGLDESTKAFLGNILGIAKQIDDVLLPIFNTLVGAVGGFALIMTSSAFINFGKLLVTLSDNAGGLLNVLRGSGLIAAVGVLSFKLAEWVDLNDRLVPGQQTLGTLIYDLVHGTDDLEGTTAEYHGALEQTRVETDLYIRGLRDLKEQYKQLAAIDKNNLLTEDDELERQREFIKLMADSSREHRVLVDVFTGEFKTFAQVEEEIAQATAKLAAEKKGWMKTVVDGVVTYEQFGDAASKSLKKVATDTDDAKKKSESFQLKLLEIASDERLKKLEFAVNLDIARLEADTTRVTKAFESINTVIESTGAVIGTALGSLADIDKTDFIKKNIIENQLKTENELRKQAIEDQRKLNDSIIRLNDARAQQLAKGGGLIQIDGSGLAPELEAFMFKVIEAVQVRVNEEASEFLLLV